MITTNFTVDFYGRPTEVGRETSIEEFVHDVVLTPLGSLEHRPTYGSKVPLILGQPLNFATARLMEYHAEEGLESNTPDINNIVVSSTINPDNNLVILRISYTIVSTGEEQSTLIEVFNSVLDKPNTLPQTIDELITEPPDITEVIFNKDVFLLGESGTTAITIKGSNFKSTQNLTISNVFTGVVLRTFTNTSITNYTVNFDTLLGSAGLNNIVFEVTTDLGTATFGYDLDIVEPALTINEVIFLDTVFIGIQNTITLNLADTLTLPYSFRDISGFTVDSVLTNSNGVLQALITPTSNSFSFKVANAYAETSLRSKTALTPRFELLEIASNPFMKPKHNSIISLNITDDYGTDNYVLANPIGFTIVQELQNNPTDGSYEFEATIHEVENISFDVISGVNSFNVSQIVKTSPAFLNLKYAQIDSNGVINAYSRSEENGIRHPDNTLLGSLGVELPTGEDGEMTMLFSRYNPSPINIAFFLYEGTDRHNWIIMGEARYDSLMSSHSYTSFFDRSDGELVATGTEWDYSKNRYFTIEMVGNTINLYDDSRTLQHTYNHNRQAPLRLDVLYTPPNKGLGTIAPYSGGQLIFTDILGNWQYI